MLVLFPLKMSTCVGPATAANIYTCCSGFYCNCLHVLVLSLLRKCLHMLVRFLLQMSACAGSVTTANDKNCWSGSLCLHVMVRVLLQMSACVGPIYSCRKCLHEFVSFYCKCLLVLVLYLLQMPICVPAANVFMYWSVLAANVYTGLSCSYLKCLHVRYCSYHNCSPISFKATKFKY